MKNFVFIACSRSGHNFVMNQVLSWFPQEVSPIKRYNYENVKCEDTRRTLMAWIEAGQIDDMYPIKLILIVRDLLNWWASYLYWNPDVADQNYQNMFDCWVSHCEEAGRVTTYLPEVISVRYDDFFQKQYMRKLVCTHAGGIYSEERLDEVLDLGGGSSFSGTKVPGQKLDVLTRFRVMKDNEKWREMLRMNPEAVELYEQEFQLTKEQKQIIDSL